MPDIELTLRACVQKLLAKSHPAASADFSLDEHLAEDLGLSSMQMVLLLTSLCKTLHIDLATLNDTDLASMTTPRRIIERLARELPAQVA